MTSFFSLFRKPILTLVAVGCVLIASASSAMGFYGPDAFVTTWNTSNPGTSNSQSITIPGA